VHRQGGELKVACCRVLEGVCSRPIEDEGRPVWVPRVISKKGFGDDVLDILEEVERAGYSPDTDVQVLTPLRRTCTQLNELLQSYFAAWGVDVNEEGLRLGDKVIQTKNDYSLNVFNGEVGIVSATDPEATRVNYDGREVTYNHDARDLMGVRTFPHKHLELAYALTVHKSQGSEYPVVIVVLPCESQLNHRNLLYTAVTRARERVYLLTSNRALEQALDTEIRDERITWLSSRAKGETP
jgi:exodeoxyribonuclease V alpha subunit